MEAKTLSKMDQVPDLGKVWREGRMGQWVTQDPGGGVGGGQTQL